MQKVLLYEPKRAVSGWERLICPGQYAVFLSDVETTAPVESDGSPINSAREYFCLLFDSLKEAEAHCREAVSRVRRLRCDVYDSAGRTNAPVASFVNEDFDHKVDSEARSKQIVLWGFVPIAASVPLFWYAWHSGAGVVWWPIFFGIQMVAAGLRLIQWGHGLKEELQYRQKQAAQRLRQHAVGTTGK